MKERINYFPQTVYNGVIFTEWEKEYEIPEEMLDISKLIRIDATPNVKNVSISPVPNSMDKKAEIEGTNVFNVIYHSPEDDKVHSFDFTDVFSAEESIKSSNEELIPTARVFCTFLTCKVLSRRKLYIKAKNKITLDVKENVALNSPEIDGSNEGLFFNTQTFPMQNYLEPSLTTFNLEETLVLDGTYPPVEKIVFSTVKIIPLDLIKGVDNATLNTSVLFKVFYESKNGYAMYSRTVPVSLSIKDDDIDENTLLYYYLSIANQSVSVEMDNYGEERVLKFKYTPALILFKVVESSAELPIDVFSSTDILDPKNINVKSEELVGIIQRPFTIEKIFEVPEVDFTEIYDTAAVIDVENITDLPEGKTLNGICAVSILGLTESGIECANFNVNFSQTFHDQKNDCTLECFTFPVQANASIAGRNMISFRVSANAVIRQYKVKNYNFISTFSQVAKREENQEYFTLYYPSKGETLWDVSKEFGKNPISISKENPSSFGNDGSFLNKTSNIVIP